MQKGEYLVIQGEYRHSSLGFKFVPQFINEQQLKDWRKTSLFSLMNQLGDDGWELVSSVGYPPRDNGNELLFKRPKP